jgi:dienelactone hydrolase
LAPLTVRRCWARLAVTGGDALGTVGRPVNRRLAEVTGWLRAQPRAARAAVGYFGTSTGATVALRAATEPGTGIAAVVPVGGCPDLARPGSLP